MSHFYSKKAMRRKYSIKLHLMVNFKDKEHFFKYRKKKLIKKSKTHNIQLGIAKPEALKSLYRSPAYKKNQLVLCKNYVLQW
jgi:hypothetical protein